MLLLSLASTALGLLQPYLTKYLIDDGLLARQFDVIVRLCVLMVVVGVGAAALGALNRWLYVDVSARILYALREAVFGHLLQLSPGYFGAIQGGELLARLDGDLAEVQRFAVDTLLALVNSVLALIGAVLLLIGLSPTLALLAFALLPLNVVFLKLMRPRVERLTRRVRERASVVTAFFVERLASVKFIQSVAAEPREAARLRALNDALRADTLRLQMLNYVTGAVPGLMSSTGTALVFVAGGYMVVRGTLSVGTLIAFTAYLARAVGPLQSLLGLYMAFQRARVSLARVLDVTAIEPAVAPPVRPRPFATPARGELCFERVTFRHTDGGAAGDAAGDADAGTPLLEELSGTLPAGGKIALCGVSGAGKSTLIDLIQRHYDPTAGRILLDGVDLRELALPDLRRRIAVVGQDTVLFGASVLDNLRYANPDAGDDEVREAARRARVDEFVAPLPQGYGTPVGSRGARLSGGQRQRLAIARALLLDPLILILDEATSAVDVATEAQIIAEIDRLFAGRTRLIISHRPQTLAGCDRVLELCQGRLRPADPTP